MVVNYAGTALEAVLRKFFLGVDAVHQALAGIIALGVIKLRCVTDWRVDWA